MSTKNRANSTQLSDPKSISDHLGELRRRLTWVVLTLILMSVLAYMVHDALVAFVLAPIGHQQLVYLTPGGGFTFIFQIVLYAGLLLSAPVMIYHLYRFVAPALPESLHRRGIRVVALSSLLMITGVCFGYLVAVPAALQFLMAFAGDFVQANLTADSYLNFLVAYVLGLGILFQLPLFLLAWNWLRPIPPGGLLSSQRYVIVGAFIAAALLTPTPDVFNQSLLAVPIIAIYQIGVVSVYIMNRKRRMSTVAATDTRMDSRYEQPVFDIASLLSGEEVRTEPAMSKQNSQHVPAPKKLQSPSARHHLRPVNTIDGFHRSHTVAVSVPHRQSTSLRPLLARPEVRLRSSTGERPRTSIDGFII